MNTLINHIQHSHSSVLYKFTTQNNKSNTHIVWHDSFAIHLASDCAEFGHDVIVEGHINPVRVGTLFRFSFLFRIIFFFPLIAMQVSFFCPSHLRGNSWLAASEIGTRLKLRRSEEEGWLEFWWINQLFLELQRM